MFWLRRHPTWNSVLVVDEACQLCAKCQHCRGGPRMIHLIVIQSLSKAQRTVEVRLGIIYALIRISQLIYGLKDPHSK